MLLDVNMPVMGGVELLKELRRRRIPTRTIATSADLDRTTKERLRAEGFADCLNKPVSLECVAQVLGLTVAVKPHADAPSSAWLDDADALLALGGDRDSLVALRRLLHAELDVVANEIGDPVWFSSPHSADRLHRLTASCGFCGAIALGKAAAMLQRMPSDPSAATTFIATLEATRSALAQSESSETILRT